MMGERQTPEYKAITCHREQLETLLKSKSHLVPVCDKLRDRRILSKEQSSAIKENGKSSELVAELLPLIEFDPVETFIEIIHVLKQIDNKVFHKFIETKIEAKAKEGYRSLLSIKSGKSYKISAYISSMYQWHGLFVFFY